MLIKNTVGKKIIMAITGQMLVLFIVIHMIGNSAIYVGGLNAYADRVHALPLLVWIFRLVMLMIFSLHIMIGIELYLENRKAKPEGYAVKQDLRATFASKNMLWTGLLTGAFLVYHLLHFTFQVINPEIAALRIHDAAGRPDVSGMVLQSFQNPAVSSVYIFAVIMLSLHLSHGIQSSFQTLGISNERTLPGIIKTGSVAALVLFLGYVSIPLLIFIGVMKG